MKMDDFQVFPVFSGRFSGKTDDHIIFIISHR